MKFKPLTPEQVTRGICMRRNTAAAEKITHCNTTC